MRVNSIFRDVIISLIFSETYGSSSSGLDEEQQMSLDEILTRIKNKESFEVDQLDPPAIRVDPDAHDTEVQNIMSCSTTQDKGQITKKPKRKHNVLLQAEIPDQVHRRRSPVNVFEWVASLPVPETLEKQDGGLVDTKASIWLPHDASCYSCERGGEDTTLDNKRSVICFHIVSTIYLYIQPYLP